MFFARSIYVHKKSSVAAKYLGFKFLNGEKCLCLTKRVDAIGTYEKEDLIAFLNDKIASWQTMYEIIEGNALFEALNKTNETGLNK